MCGKKTTIGCAIILFLFSLFVTAQIPEGGLVITEIMPNAGVEPGGEYIELYNPSNEQYVLDGLILEDNGGTHVILACQPINPGQYLLLCSDFDVVGNDTCDYEYGVLRLSNTGDFVRLLDNGTIIDEVQYTSSWPYADGVSMNLDLSAFNSVLNDDSGNWCESTQTFGGGDLGTPGLENSVCSAPTTTIPTSSTTSSTTTSTTSVSSTTTVTSATTTSLADVVINEFLSDVGDTDWDDDGKVDASDDEWIELYNNEDYEVDISGWAFADEAGKRYVLPEDTLIDANDFLVFYGSETGIPLNNGGDTIYLLGPLNDTVDSIDYSDSAPDKDESFGRYPDGDEDWALFSDPTPDNENPEDAPDGWCNEDGDCPDDEDEYFCQDGDVWVREFEGDCDTETHECDTKESEKRHKSCSSPRACVEGVDECVMPTTTTIKAACYSNADCKDTVRGSAFCESNNVYQNVLWAECINPGQENARCEEKTQTALVESCGEEKTCSQGVCRMPTTTTLEKVTTSSTVPTISSTTIVTTTTVLELISAADETASPTGFFIAPHLLGVGIVFSELFMVGLLFAGLFTLIYVGKKSTKDDDL